MVTGPQGPGRAETELWGHLVEEEREPGRRGDERAERDGPAGRGAQGACTLPSAPVVSAGGQPWCWPPESALYPPAALTLPAAELGRGRRVGGSGPLFLNLGLRQGGGCVGSQRRINRPAEGTSPCEGGGKETCKPALSPFCSSCQDVVQLLGSAVNLQRGLTGAAATNDSPSILQAAPAH